MRSIYNTLLSSHDILSHAIEIDSCFDKIEEDVVSKLSFVCCFRSKAVDSLHDGLSIKDSFSISDDALDISDDAFTPVVLTWDEILCMATSDGVCVINKGASLSEAKNFEYKEAAFLDDDQMHALVMSIDALSENGHEWYSLTDKGIKESRSRSRSDNIYRLPWLANRNSSKLSPIKISDLTLVPILSKTKDSISIRLLDRIIEVPCPESISYSNKNIFVNDDGLVLRRREQSFF